jgi:integrase/recombinase XerC
LLLPAGRFILGKCAGKAHYQHTLARRIIPHKKRRLLAGARRRSESPAASASKREGSIEPAGEKPASGSDEVVSGPAFPLAVAGPSEPSAKDVLRHFLGGRRPTTLRAYQQDLKAFAKWLGLGGAEAATEALLQQTGPRANALVLDWLNTMTEAGLAPATRARRLSALRALAKVARVLGVISWHLEVEGPKVEPYRDTRGPSAEIIQRLREACSEGRKGQRDRLLLALAVGLGLRRSEIAGLRASDFDREQGRLLVRGKGGKEVWVSLPGQLTKALSEWISADAPPQQLVLNLTPNGVYRVVQRVGKRAGVKVWPHALRHSSITTGLGEHLPQHVKRFSRHSSLDTMEKYDDNRLDPAAAVAQSIADKLLGDSV